MNFQRIFSVLFSILLCLAPALASSEQDVGEHNHVIKVFGHQANPFYFARSILQESDESLQNFPGVLSGLEKSPTHADILLSHPEFMRGVASLYIEYKDEDYFSAFEQRLFMLIHSFSEAVRSQWTTSVFTTLGDEYDIPFKAEFLGVLGRADRAEINNFTIQIRDLSTPVQNPTVQWYPSDYPTNLQNLFSELHGQEGFLTLLLLNIRGQLPGLDEEEKIRKVSEANMIGLKLHMSVNPSDIFFDGLPAYLLLPLLTDEETDRQLVEMILKVRVLFELDVLDAHFAQDPETPQDVRDHNVYRFFADIKAAALISLQKNNIDQYSSLREFYSSALKGAHKATWGDFRKAFTDFYILIAGTKQAQRQFRLPKRVFTDHEDLQDTDLLIPARLSLEFLREAGHSARGKIDMLHHEIDALASRVENSSDQSEYDDLGKLYRISAVLDGTLNAVEAGDTLLASRLWSLYIHLRTDLIGLDVSIEDMQSSLYGDLPMFEGVYTAEEHISNLLPSLPSPDINDDNPNDSLMRIEALESLNDELIQLKNRKQEILLRSQEISQLESLDTNQSVEQVGGLLGVQNLEAELDSLLTEMKEVSYRMDTLREVLLKQSKLVNKMISPFIDSMREALESKDTTQQNALKNDPEFLAIKPIFEKIRSILIFHNDSSQLNH